MREMTAEEKSKKEVLYWFKTHCMLKCGCVYHIVLIFHGSLISRIWNRSQNYFIQLKFETLHCNTHGQHEFAKYKRYTVSAIL